MKKKFVAILLSGLLLITAGCTKDNLKKEEVQVTPQQTEPVTDLKAAWAQKSVFYEVFVRSFYDGNGDGIGDFLGLKEKVSYLKDLGIDALWLMPMMDSSSYHGYDVKDYNTTETDYGTMDDFKAFLEEAHKNDIKVTIDFVVNHTSIEHPWFVDASKNENSKYRDYYIWAKEGDDTSENKWHKIEGTNSFYYGRYAKTMPDLNYKNPKVREEVKAIAKHWLDIGVDGFRLDGAREIDEDMAITHEWWREFNDYVKSINSDAFVVGENWYQSPGDIATFYGELESSFNFPLSSQIIGMANGVGVDVLSDLSNTYTSYSSMSTLRGTDKFIDSTMLTNHDMDRTATRLGGSIEKTKIAAALLFTLPGTPFVYYGDEIGQLGQKPDDNRREPFDWYKTSEGKGMTKMTSAFFNPMAYTKADDGISLEEQQGAEGSIYEYYKKLIKIRKDNSMLFNGEFTKIGTQSGMYGYTVNSGENSEKLVIIHNQRPKIKEIEVTADTAVELLKDKQYTKGEKISLGAFESIIIKYSGDTLPIKEDTTAQPEPDYTVTFKAKLPASTPADEKVYIVGDFNNWNPGDENYVLKKGADGFYEISIKKPGYSIIEYKFTRGDWEKREQNSAGQDLVGPTQSENRKYSFTEDNHVEDIVIEKWFDKK